MSQRWQDRAGQGMEENEAESYDIVRRIDGGETRTEIVVGWGGKREKRLR